VVEVTASADVNVLPRDGTAPRRRRPAGNHGRVLRQTYAQDRLFDTSGQKPASPSAPASPVVRPEPAPGGRSPSPSPLAPPSPQNDAQLAEELKHIRQMVGRMMRQQGERSRPDLPDQLFSQYLSLLEQEVAEELAENVLTQVRTKLEDSELEDRSKLRSAIREALADLIPTDGAPSRVEAGDGRPLTIALIGPTGVGKTTTVAKLAATFKLRHRKNVALITIDTYRIAAVEQLRTYANIIGLTLHVVTTLDEMRQALEECRNVDAVLIDTAGRSQRDGEKLDQLKAFLDVASPHETHLVLSSTCSQPVLMEAVERFSEVRTDRIIFTKLDEAVSFGVLVNVARKVNKQLSYVTTGQEVPHQIEPGQGERLAGLILGEKL